MPAEKISMRTIKTVLRLHFEAKLGIRATARSLQISHSTVSDYVKRAKAAGLGWPLPAEMDDTALVHALFPDEAPSSKLGYLEPDYAQIHQELKRKGVTKQLLWQEYQEACSGHGYRYSQYCHRYALWLNMQKRSMRQTHRAGDKLFVDYSGVTVPIVNPDTGELRQAQIFVAVLGASNYTFVTATWSQQQQDWVNAHVKAFEYFQGVPAMIIPDNLKSAVTTTHRYTPTLNAAYQQMAAYYQTTILPARPYHPKDKAKVEVAVQIVQRWILARLRHQTHFTLASLNQAILVLLKELNQRKSKHLPDSRQQLFERLDKPALQKLPAHPYVFVDIKSAKVHIDYHIEYDKHYYSVPHQWVSHPVDVHASANVVQIYRAGVLIASHARGTRHGGQTTCLEHMPTSHRAMQEWTPERFIRWASDIGPATASVANHLLQKKQHPEQNFRSVLALLSYAKKYTRQRLENACTRALAFNSPSRRSVESILKNGLDHLPLPTAQHELPLEIHENIRGETYYH